MKRILTLAAAAFLMGGVAFAQHPEGGRHHDGDQRHEHSLIKAQERTDRMAERYGLSDEQKIQLFELNKKQEDEQALRDIPRGERPHGPRPGAGPGNPPQRGQGGPEQGGHARIGEGGPHHGGHGEMHRPGGPGPEQFGGPGHPTRDDLKARDKAYRKELKKIMTPEQFKLYKKDVKARKKAGEGRR